MPAENQRALMLFSLVACLVISGCGSGGGLTQMAGGGATTTPPSTSSSWLRRRHPPGSGTTPPGSGNDASWLGNNVLLARERRLGTTLLELEQRRLGQARLLLELEQRRQVRVRLLLDRGQRRLEPVLGRAVQLKARSVVLPTIWLRRWTLLCFRLV